MEKDTIQQLEQQVDELLRASRGVRDENVLLKSEQSIWLGERAQLVAKTNTARARIEAMVERLKELDDEG